jgi:uncharacterized membrane protein YeaQ/YmgE (transglycosylase-associated protein family)
LRAIGAGGTVLTQRGLAMFGVLGWIIFGLIVGVVAKLIMPGRDPGGFIVTILLGIAGALLGGWVGRALGLYGPEDAAGFLMALAGAILLLVLYRMFLGRRTTVVR